MLLYDVIIALWGYQQQYYVRVHTQMYTLMILNKRNCLT